MKTKTGTQPPRTIVSLISENNASISACVSAGFTNVNSVRPESEVDGVQPTAIEQWGCNSTTPVIKWVNAYQKEVDTMSERIDNLRALVEELEQELHGVETLDEETRELLRNTTTEIQAALEADTISELPEQSLSAQLDDAVSEFESSHPTIYAVVNRMVDVLGQMGI